MFGPHRPRPQSRAAIIPEAESPDEVPVQLDLLRAELYRILDDLARSSPEARPELFVEFEHSWAQFREALDRPCPAP